MVEKVIVSKLSASVKFNADIVSRFNSLDTSYKFSEFVQMAVREQIDRKKKEMMFNE